MADKSHNPAHPLTHPIVPKRLRKKNRQKKPRPMCLKCGGVEQITRHHVIPRVHLSFFKIKIHDAPTASLCCKCHHKIEEKILWTEAFINRTKVGDRKPLPKVDDYWYILSMFIGTKRFGELLKNGKVTRHPTCPAH